MMIETAKGPIDDAQLVKVERVVEDTADHRMIRTDYYLDGEFVRNDLHLDIKRGLALVPETL